MAKTKPKRFWNWTEPVWQACDGDDSETAERTLYINGVIADTELAAIFNRPANIDKIIGALKQSKQPETPEVQGKPVADCYSHLNTIMGGF